jgi:hypothetical protein
MLFRPSRHTASVRAAVGAVILCITVTATSFCQAAEPGDPEVESALRDFYKAFLKRPLTRDELRQLMAEAAIVNQRRSPQLIAEVVSRMHQYAALIRRHDPRDGGIYQRHIVISNVYFAPKGDSPIERELILSPDPVRVADYRGRRLMTESDLVAFANIARWVSSGGPPQHFKPTRLQIDELARLLQNVYDNYDPDNPQFMPRFHSEAAEFWAGIRHEWPKLSQADRDLMRQYPQLTFQMEISDELFQRVWGLDPDDAAIRGYNDRMEATRKVISMGGELELFMSFYGARARDMQAHMESMGIILSPGFGR